MNIEIARSVLLWCTVINFGVLLVWGLFFIVAHDWLHRLHRRWFRLSVEEFDAIHYRGMATYKAGVILLNLTPYLALVIVT